MGKFQSGIWLIGLMIYFFLLFTIIYTVVEAGKIYEEGVDYSTVDYKSVSADDVGFQNIEPQPVGNETFKRKWYAISSASISPVLSTLSIITGIGSGHVYVGMPVTFKYIFSFFFFWIPYVILIWAIYMALPFAH